MTEPGYSTLLNPSQEMPMLVINVHAVSASPPKGAEAGSSWIADRNVMLELLSQLMQRGYLPAVPLRGTPFGASLAESDQYRDPLSLDPTTGGDPFALRIALTFDDVRAGAFELAMEAGARFGVTSLLFPVPCFLDGGEIPAEERYSDFLSWDQLGALVEAGHAVGSHGLSHKPLDELERAELEDELVRSKEYIEKRLGCAVAALSLPHGRTSRAVNETAAKLGYREVYTAYRGWNKQHTPSHRLRRLDVRSYDTVQTLMEEIDWFELSRPFVDVLLVQDENPGFRSAEELRRLGFFDLVVTRSEELFEQLHTAGFEPLLFPDMTHSPELDAEVTARFAPKMVGRSVTTPAQRVRARYHEKTLASL